jgi:hypothetical protein
MTSSSNHVAPATNGSGQPKKKLVLNAFVEMCMLTSQPTNNTSNPRQMRTDNTQAPATNLPASGNTPTINPQTSIPSNTGPISRSN